MCPVTGARYRIPDLVEGSSVSRRAFRGAYPSQRISARERRAREAARWIGAMVAALEAQSRGWLQGHPYSVMTSKPRLYFLSARKFEPSYSTSGFMPCWAAVRDELPEEAMGC